MLVGGFVFAAGLSARWSSTSNDIVWTSNALSHQTPDSSIDIGHCVPHQFWIPGHNIRISIIIRCIVRNRASPKVRAQNYQQDSAPRAGGCGRRFGMIVGFLGEMSKNANPAESFRQQKVGLINAFVLLCSPSPAVVNTVRMPGRTRVHRVPGPMILKVAAALCRCLGPRVSYMPPGARPRCATSWRITTKHRRRWTRWRS